MKRAVLVLGMAVLVGSGVAEASQFSSGLGKTWTYLTSPVNCIAQLGSDVVGAVSRFVICVLGNANPHNLIP